MQQHIAHDLQEKERTKDVTLKENVTFASLLLKSEIQNGLTESGFKKPSPIQFKAIPLGRCGFDLIVKSKSGTGKTLVFSTITLETVNVAKITPQVLILVPTREIAVQIEDVLKNIGRFIEGLSIGCFIGGMPLEDDIKKCSQCHVAVGAPGRVKHLITLGALSTKSIRLFVLDEADKLMETTFQNDINEIYDVLPPRKQLIATSATYPQELDTFLANYMLSPTHVTSENETPLLLGLKQFVAVLNSNTINAVQQMKAKNEILVEIFTNVSFTQCLVFTNYQSRTESVSNYLNQKGWNSSFISAAVEQSGRLEAINNLKNFKSRILLSTDLTARGIDAANVDLVINYDLPVDAVTYLHRMGRAGRYGSTGICINFALEGLEIKKMQTILGSIGATNLSISKLPPLKGGGDLWQLDVSGLEQIWGVVPESANEVSETIKKEVLLMKQSARSNKNNKNSKNSKNCNKKKIKFEDAKGTTNDKESPTTNNKKNKKIKLEDLTKESVEDFLKCNKEDTPTRGKNNKKKIKLEELSSEGVENMLLGKEKEEEKDSTTCFDTDNLLSSLIGDESDDSKKRKREIKIEEKENETLISSDDTNCDDILSSLINGETPEDDSKKRKLNEPTIGIKDDKNETLSKNKALLSITRLLIDFHTHIDTDLADTLDGYLTILKDKNTDDQISTAEDILLLNSSTDTVVTKTEDVEIEIEAPTDELDIEDIFKAGYQCALTTSDKTWLNSLPSQDIQTFQEFCRQEQVTISSESENEELDYEMEAYDEEDDENPTNDVALQWVPVESSSADHFTKCYDDCSTVLWQTGLTFETVAEFDNWYYHWQEQVQSVRNYVQQNIYVEEMSKYQQQRLTDK
ncbi:probable ATP-dependent RNA helicase DDX20 [Zophobas morio]|uniref:probable ATP-dependent RNA helicase DDX20 n=1 Tax=Zophobas morio TaxID=2755281 RepID=UPI003082B21E